MHTRIIITTGCSLLLLAACGGGSSGGGDDIDTGAAVLLDTASAEENEVAQQTDEALDRSLSAAVSSISSASTTNAASGKRLSLPAFATAAATETETLTLDNVAVDTNADGTDDAVINGSGTAEITGDANAGSLEFDLDMTLSYTADAAFTDADGSYTIRTGSSLRSELAFEASGSNQVNSASIDYRFTLDDYTVAWTSGSDSGTTVLNGSYRLTAADISIGQGEDPLSADLSGTTSIDLSGTVTVNGITHTVVYEGQGTFTMGSAGLSLSVTAYMSIDGTVYGPITEDDLFDQAMANN